MILITQPRQFVAIMLWALWLLLPFQINAASNQQGLEYVFPVDPNSQLTDLKTNTQWQPSEDGWITETFSEYDFWFGETPKVAWLRIDPSLWQSGHANSKIIELASSGLSRAILHYQINGRWLTLNSDVLLQKFHQGQLEQSIVPSRFITFETSKHWQTGPIYLRVESINKLLIQVNIAPKHQHIANSLTTEALFFFCYGVLFVIALYNLVIGRYLQDKLYYFYSLAIFSTLFYQFFAHGHARLFGYINWDDVNRILNFLSTLSALTALIFLYHFANLRRFTPLLAKLFIVFLLALAIASSLTLFVSLNAGLNIALIGAGSAPALAMIVALWASYRGSKAAGIFVLAWSIYLIGGLLWLLYWLGSLTLNHWVEFPLVIGATLESILLSLALGYRLQLMQEQGLSLEQRKDYYKSISALDPMTKLANRRAFDQQLENLLNDRVKFNLVLVDIDHFKNFNDTYGHLAGDKVIKKLGEVLQQAVRSDDMAARIGGEEFALIFSNQSLTNTRTIAERIRMKFSETAFLFEEKTIFSTVSLGIASVNSNDTLDELIERADKALYRAKKKGRNQTQISVNQVTS